MLLSLYKYECSNLRSEMVFYTYAYLREDRSPYYIGKGKGDRVYKRQRKDTRPPKDKSRILILKQNLTEDEAFRHEIYMIAVYGRKDLGTGILHNRTNGGDGTSGVVVSEETRRKISVVNKGRILSEETKKRMSDARKGETLSEEHKEKLSEAKKGEKNPQYGKPSWNKDGSVSEETRRKLSKCHEKYHYTIYSITEDKIYETNTLKGFCEEHSLYRSPLTNTYTGRQNHHKGFKIIKKESIIPCG